VIHDWKETSLVCNVDITDVILPSDAEYLMLTFYVKALKDPGIFSMHGPLLLLSGYTHTALRSCLTCFLLSVVFA